MKKFILVSAVVLFFGLAPVAFAQGFVPLAKIPGLTDIQPTQEGLATFFNNLYKYVIGFAAILAVIMITWGGLEISTQDSISKQGAGRERITQAIFGLILVLSPVLIFSIINPSILNLSLNLPKIDLTAPPGPTTPGTTTIDSTTQCSVSGIKNVLQVATCPSWDAADKWGKDCTGKLFAGDTTYFADGKVSSSIMICDATQNYVFIHAISAGSTLTINQLQPLAVTTANLNNGSNVMNYIGICQSIGRKTCISDLPIVTFAVDCLPVPKTPVPKGATGKCYNETLTCEKSPLATLSNKCAGSPNWTPFQ